MSIVVAWGGLVFGRVVPALPISKDVRPCFKKRGLTGLRDSECDYFSFALTSMSLSDFPLLNDVMGGSVNVVFNKGWLCMRCQCFKRMSLRLGSDELYCVTNGKIGLFAFVFGRRADSLSLNATQTLFMECTWHSASVWEVSQSVSEWLNEWVEWLSDRVGR